MSLAYDDIAHSKHTEDHPCSEEFCLPKCQHSQERQGAQRAEAPNVVPMSTSSSIIDDNSPTANMYGCEPCPKCGSKYRCVMAATPDTIDCDDCGHSEKVTENRNAQ
jgi:hypothetical protein